MSLIILPDADKKNDWSMENGREVVWYDENPQTKHVIMTSPMTPRRVGYVRHKTTDPKEMDRVFRRMNEQERGKNEELIEKLYRRGRAQYEALRERLRQRLVSADTKEWEKAFIREALRRMADRDHANQQNTRYGVASMEEKEAPIKGVRTKVN